MFEIVEGNSHGLADVGKFIDLINSPPFTARDFFDPRSDIFVARAPGRLDVMGGIADYSGSLVFQMPIAEAICSAAQKCEEPVIKIISLARRFGRDAAFEMRLSDLDKKGKPRDYASVRDFFARNRSRHWASYAAGVFYVLRRELGVNFKQGCRILISSEIPSGKGVSSSAALEVAVMNAVCSAYDITIEPREIAVLCQKVENLIVGASCGIMDQMSTNCGVENSLISILCQPAEIQETVKIPDGIEFWGIDSGVRHAVAGSDYASVRVGAFMGYRMIAEIAGLNVTPRDNGLVEIDDTLWNGYLCNVSPAQYEREFAPQLPDKIKGAEFTKHYSGTTDRVTTIDPAKTYAVKAATEHGIYENFRVRAFSELMKEAATESRLDLLGELMFQTHTSYAACGLTESGTDRIVEMVRENRGNGLFGARITGGGSGGTVVILAARNSESAIAELAAKYQSETGRKPFIFSGSSPGSAAFGHLLLRSISNAE